MADEFDIYVMKSKLDKAEKELAEAKRRLKSAVEDFSRMDNHIYSCDRLCDDCPLSGERDHCLKWRYADEALKLIGGSETSYDYCPKCRADMRGDSNG